MSDSTERPTREQLEELDRHIRAGRITHSDMEGLLYRGGRLGPAIRIPFWGKGETLAEMLERSPATKVVDYITAEHFPLALPKDCTVFVAHLVCTSRELYTGAAHQLIRSFGLVPGSLHHLLAFERTQDANKVPLPRGVVAATGNSFKASWTNREHFAYIDQGEYKRGLNIQPASYPWPPFTQFLAIQEQ